MGIFHILASYVSLPESPFLLGVFWVKVTFRPVMQVDDGKMKHDFAKGLSLGHHSFEQ